MLVSLDGTTFLLRSKEGHWLHDLLGKLIPGWNERFWTTLRLPFDELPTVWHPVWLDTEAAAHCLGVLEHEAVHVRQQSTWGGWLWTLACMVLPLPAFLSGRWFVERDAYLYDIRAGRRSVESSVQTLWRSYGWCWPKKWMRKWFETQLK